MQIDELFFDVSYRVDQSQAQRAQDSAKEIQRVISGGREELEQFGGVAGASFRQIADEAKKADRELDGFGEGVSERIQQWERDVSDVELDVLDEAAQARIARQGRGAGEEAGRQFGEAFSERAERQGREVADSTIEALKGQFRAQTSDAREALFRGLIDEDEFRRRATRAAEQFNEGVLTTIRRLADRGALDEETQARLTSELKDAGRRGGQGFADEADTSIKDRLLNLPRWVRGTLAAGIVAGFAFAARGAVRVMREAGRRIQQVLETAGEVQALEQGFQTLTLSRGLDPTDTLQRLRRAVRGTVDDMELMRITNEALQGGISVTEEQLEELVDVARRTGRSLGIDATESYQRFVQGIVRGRRQILDDLGIIVDWGTAYERAASELGTTTDALTEQQKVQARANEVLRAGSDLVDDLGEESLTAGERVDQMNTFFLNVARTFARVVATSPRVRSALDDIGTSAEALADTMAGVEIAIGSAVDTMLDLETVTDVLSVLRVFQPGGDSGPLGALAGLSRISSRRQENALRRAHEIDLRRVQTATDLEALRQREARLNEQIDGLLREQARSGERNQEIVDQTRRAEEALLEVRERITELEADTGGGGGGDEGLGLSEEEIESRISAVEDLITRMETLEEFGLESLFGELPSEAGELVGRIENLDAQIESVQEALATGEAPAGMSDALERLQTLSAEAREELRKMVEEGLVPDEVAAAEERLRGMTEQLDRLRSVGAEGGVSDAPPQLLATLDALGEIESRIETLDEALEVEGLDPELRADAEALRGELTEQRDELQQAAQEWEELSDVVEAFGGLGEDLFRGMTPEEMDAVSAAVRRVSDEVRAVGEAQAELELAEEGTDAYREASDNLADAQAALGRELARVQQDLRRAGFSGRELADIMAILRGETEGTNEEAEGLAETMADFEGVARGVLSVADAAGILSDELRQVLRGAIDVSSALQSIAEDGLEIGNIAQGLGGVVGIVGGIAGELPFGESARDEAVRENTRALRELRQNIDQLANLVASRSGDLIEALRNVFDFDPEQFRDFAFGRTLGGSQPEDVQRFILDRLDEFGLSISDLEDVAEDAKLPIDELVRLLDGEDLDADEIRAAAEQFLALQDAVDQIDLANLVETFDGVLRIIEARFEAFDIEDPVEKLEILREAFLRFADLPDAQAQRIEGLNLQSAEGRAAFEEIIQAWITMLQEGDFPEGSLGELDSDEFIQTILRMEGLIDQAADAAEGGADAESFQIFRGATELRASRIEGALVSIDLVSRKQLAELISIREAVGGAAPEDIPFLQPPQTGGNGLTPPMTNPPAPRAPLAPIDGPLLHIENFQVPDTSERSAEAFAEDAARRIEQKLGGHLQERDDSLGRIRQVVQ